MDLTTAEIIHELDKALKKNASRLPENGSYLGIRTSTGDFIALLSRNSPGIAPGTGEIPQCTLTIDDTTLANLANGTVGGQELLANDTATIEGDSKVLSLFASALV